MLRAIRLAHEHRNVPADNVASAIAEHPLGGLVEGGDRAAVVDDDDRVDGGVEQRVKFGGGHGSVLIASAGIGRHT